MPEVARTVENAEPSTYTTVTLSLPPARFAWAISVWTTARWIARVPSGHVQHLSRCHQVAQPVAAQDERRVRFKRRSDNFNEIVVSRRVPVASHVAKNFVSTGVAHGLELIELTGIFAFADGRVIVGELLDRAGPQLVEPRIADVTDRDLAILDDGGGQDAGHSGPFRIGPREAVDLVVGERDRFAQPLLGRTGRPLESGTHLQQRGLGCNLPPGMATDTVDDDEDAAVGIAMETILVVLPDAARIASARAVQGQAIVRAIEGSCWRGAHGGEPQSAMTPLGAGVGGGEPHHPERGPQKHE